MSNTLVFDGSRRRCYTFLQDVLSELTPSFSENLRVLSRKVCELSGSRVALYFRYKNSTDEGYLASGYNIETSLIGECLPKDAGCEAMRRWAISRFGLEHVVSIPVSFRGEESGCIMMLSGEPHQFTVEEHDALQAVALVFSYSEGRQDALGDVSYKNRVGAALLSINKYLSRAKSREALLGAVCRELVDKQGVFNAWIALVGDDGLLDGEVFHAGFKEERFAKMHVLLRKGRMPDCARQALIQNGLQIIDTPAVSCSACPLSKGYAGRGGLCVQISHDGRTYGWLTVSVPAKYVSDHIEQALLVDLADAVALHLYAMELEKQRCEAQERKDVLLGHFERLSAFRLAQVQLAHNVPVGRILRETIDEAERWTGSSMGFFHFIDEVQGYVLPQAWSTRTAESRCRMKGGASHSPRNPGVWADAVKEKRAVIHNDYHTLPGRKGIPEGHPEVVRELVVPIIRDNVVKAILGVGNKEEPYSEEDARWVSAIGDQAWDIIENKLFFDRQKALHAQIEHASKMEMIGKLAAGITHEINNPLNFISLNVSSLEADYTELAALLGHYRELLEGVERAGQSTELTGKIRSMEHALDLDGLLVDLPKQLAATRQGVERITGITRSMRSLSFKSITDTRILSDINRVVQDAVMLAAHESKGVADLRVESATVPEVECNPSQIGQVLLNLILNSLQAIKSQQRSSPGSVIITTWYDARWVYCSVGDDGPGIDESIGSEVYTPFFTTKDQGLGTGLGLSISFDIVRKHGGTLTFNCPPEGGTVFTLSLPL